MIGKLKGVVDSFGDDWVILDVHGVGYHVFCSARTLQRLPKAGEAATLSIETYVREDMIRLFGFTNDMEREWFRLLMTVQGVGAKVALGVLSVLDPGALATAISLKDLGSIGRAPGVGRRLAERIATELKDKAPAYADADPSVIRTAQDVAEARLRPDRGGRVGAGQPRLCPDPGGRRGHRRRQGVRGEATTEQLIRLGLKELAR